MAGKIPGAICHRHEAMEAEYGRITRIRFHAAYNTGLGSKMSRIFSGEWQFEFDLWFTASESCGEGITLWIHDGKVTSIRDLLFSKQQPAGPVRNPAGWYYEGSMSIVGVEIKKK